MDNKIHDLDEGLVEYFDFKLFGHTYRFKQLNTEEVKEMTAMGSDETGDKLQEYLYRFITPVSPNAPEFMEISKKMTLPHLKKFNQMIKQEFGLEVEK
jgi:hypothetical protein